MVAFGAAGVLSVILAASSGFLGWTKMCSFKECCHKKDESSWIRYEQGCSDLRQVLRGKIHGQPLIIDPIVASLRRHLANDEPPKALVLYFSGWAGTGKTFTSKLIASNLYSNGLQSNYVKHISAVHHFPRKMDNPELISYHKQRLRDMIRETVQQCERSLIIIDEVDKLPAGVIDALKPLIDFNWNVDNVNYRKAIFILMSNTGSEKLKEFAYYIYREGKSREDMVKNKSDLEKILKREALIADGGLGQSSLLENHLINLFVPFFPLERSHVEKCVHDEMASQNITLYGDDKREFVETILSDISYFPSDVKLYSESGCKFVYDKVSNFASLRDEL